MDYAMKKINGDDFYNYIISRIEKLNQVKKVSRNPAIKLSDFQRENIANTLEYMINSGDEEMQKDASNLFKDILTSKNRGKIYELLVYSFFRELEIPFKTHITVPKESSMKFSKEYIGDGSFSFGFEDEEDDEKSSVLFEIKSFGIGEPILLQLKEQLRLRLPDYYILVEGSLDVSTKDVQNLVMGKLDDIKNALINNESADGDLYYSIPTLNVNIRAIPYDKFIRERIIVGDVSSFHPYKWARDNESYFIKHCSQVCKDRPYIIICPFDECVEHTFSIGKAGAFTDIVNTAFRSLARRMFIGMDKWDKKLIELDGKAQPGICISTVVKCISGLMFIDVNKSHLENGKCIWLYINPNAVNKIPKYQLDQLGNFNYYNVVYDDFLFDNY